MIKSGDEIIAAIIGGSKCGKTTVARALVAKRWRVDRLRSIVYDPWLKKYGNTWGPSAWVTDDLEKYKRAVWNMSKCCVIWDESTDSINKYDRKDEAFFSRIRHEHKAFYLICHDLVVMNPTMRGNLSDMYVFRQGETRARKYAEDFAEQDLRQLSSLEKREFIHWRPFEKIRRLKPTLSELNSVV